MRDATMQHASHGLMSVLNVGTRDLVVQFSWIWVGDWWESFGWGAMVELPPLLLYPLVYTMTRDIHSSTGNATTKLHRTRQLANIAQNDSSQEEYIEQLTIMATTSSHDFGAELYDNFWLSIFRFMMISWRRRRNQRYQSTAQTSPLRIQLCCALRFPQDSSSLVFSRWST